MNENTIIVIFGASGDLTHRKLIPALYSLYVKKRMPDKWRIVGVSRSTFSDDEFRQNMESGVKEFANDKYNAGLWQKFAANVTYRPLDLGDVADMQRLDAYLRQFEENNGPCNRLYYLAIAPRLYEPAIANLGAANLVDESEGWRHVVIEKPFGHDLQSAQALNTAVHQVLRERQIYRIDHYLGKETVQNLLVFRFANSLFEPVWNRNYIDHVQITATETVDVGHRAGYYDGVGVVRDMVQNHMLQLLSLVAMEPPASFEADALRNEKAKVFSAIRPIQPHEVAKHTVRAQYRGYSEAEGVAPNSETATYTALRFYIDNWRWQGVPFYLRSGKALADKSTEITIFFKRPPHVMFPMPPGSKLAANYLSICVQPDEGIHFSFQAKVPDTAADMRPVDMSFHYDDTFGPTSIPEAYERLLFDALKGDASLFTRGDAIELAWQLVDPILAGWETEAAPPLALYEPGSWGPAEADLLINHDGFTWVQGCDHDM
ncbi:MAG: glucose-6-phosphate dehydrogenase [Chloroflexota bacterium]